MIELRNQTERIPHSISFTLLHIQLYDSTETTSSVLTVVHQPTLICVTRGRLQIAADDRRIELHPGELLSLAASTDLEIWSTDERPFSYHLISYDMQRTGDPGDAGRPNVRSGLLNASPHFPASILPHLSLWKVSWQRLSKGLDQLCKDRWSSDPLQQVANHMHFQEWMMFILLERNLQQGTKQSSKKAVEHAIDYMHAAFHEDITVDKLAIEARLSRRQFIELFRKLTNKSVTEYLTDLRIQEAKKLLLAGGQLSYIARTVGYRDEYYFNRRFKQIVGQAPRQYALNKQRSLNRLSLASSPQRIVADQYMGQLLKLGVIPVGARKGMLREEFIASEHSRNRSLQHITDLGNGFPLNLSHVSKLQPDLIVTQNEHQYQQLEQIAPTLLIPYQSAGPFEKLRLLSSTLNKTDLAEQWIEDYEYRIEQVRTQLMNKLGLGYSVTNLLLMNDQLFVLGRQAGYGSFSLYQALRLHPPHLQMRGLDEASLSIEIPLSALPEYAGDHIFISVYGNSSTLIDSEVWRRLPAVRKGCVYFCNPYRFAFEDPYSLDDQLQIIAASLLMVR